MPTVLRAAALTLLGGLSLTAQAQQSPATNEPRTVVEYFDKEHNKLPSAAGAVTRMEIQYQDSLHATATTYNADGTKLLVLPFEHYRKHVLHGAAEYWYKNGQLHWRDNWVHGKRDGELVAYYPTGQLKRREQYKANVVSNSTCFAADGQPKPCRAFEKMPEPPGGMNGLMTYLGNNIHYPAEALRSGIEGKVFVGFLVDSLGQVVNPVVRQSLHPLLDAEALRVIAAMPKWQPGWQDERPVMVTYTVPVSFVIRGGLFLRRQKPRKENPEAGL